MNIGIDGSRAFIQGRTGTENYSYQLIKNMSLIDTQNRYLIYLRPGNSLGLGGEEAGMEDGHWVGGQSAKVKDWPANFRFKIINLPRFWTQVGLGFRTFVDPLDVLFVPSHTLPLIRKPGLKTVITVHDLGAEYLPGLHQLKQILYLKLMTHYQIKTATKVISVSKATKSDLLTKIGINSKKIEVVYEGVDKEVFSRQLSAVSLRYKDTVLDKYDLVNNKFFLFVGTIQPRKNLERIIRAFAEFLKWEVRGGSLEMGGLEPLKSASQEIEDSKKHKSISKTSHLSHPTSQFKLVLVGGKGWKTEGIYELPAELGIEDRVRFLGKISDQELVGLYNGALGLVYPSLFEGFGLPIVEAMACGCPVITSNLSSMPEVAGDAAILVDPYKKEQITEAMLRLFKSDILRSRLINKGNIRSSKFDWKLAAARTIEILTQAGGG